MPQRSIRSRLARGEVVLGTMAFELHGPGLARIAANAGADFIILDMEHSGWGYETIKQQIALARGAGLLPIVNPPRGTHEHIGRCLDLGAGGLLIPAVETRAQAEALVQAARYPPDGTRGAAFGVAHDDYRAGDVARTMAAANRSVLLMAKIETVKGVENAGAILATPGIDVGFIGHTDLSVSMGHPAKFTRPQFLKARDAVVAACRRHGKAAGCFSPGPEVGLAWIEAGFQVVNYSGDIWLLGGALKAGFDVLRTARPCSPRLRRKP
jgi:2-dehydro-3-deoxyglucarate aldolase/4-hydroxy-2-oxoheptanedioate aldolase